MMIKDEAVNQCYLWYVIFEYIDLIKWFKFVFAYFYELINYLPFSLIRNIGTVGSLKCAFMALGFYLPTAVGQELESQLSVIPTSQS